MVRYLSEFQKHSNSDYQKSSLTLISEYQKLIRRAASRRAALTTGKDKQWNAVKLGARAFGRAAGMHCQRHVLFGIAKAINARFDTDLFAQRGARSRQADGACRSDRPPADEAAVRRQSHRSFAENCEPPLQRTQAARISLAGAGVRAGQAGEAALRPDRPRHLSLTDLEAGDCRYPYGGDAEGEAITFCGHPQPRGSSYCIAHFHLTRNPSPPSERAAVPSPLLRLVEAA